MIRFIIKLYILLLFLDSVLSFFPETMRFEWRRKIKRLCDKTCDPVRRVLPHHLAFDFSPLIVILGLYLFIELFGYLW